MNKAPLNEFVNQLHEAESSFILSKSLDLGFDESLAYFASNIINQRMFIYGIEKNQRDSIRLSQNNSNMATLYEYFNDFLDDKNSAYRNLIRYEIEQLIEGTALNVDQVESCFVMEHATMNTSIFLGLFKKETNLNVNIKDIDVRKIENLLIHMRVDRKTSLKYCIAALCACFERGNEEKIHSLIGERTKKFYEFYDTVIGQYSHYDNESFMIIVFLAAFSYIFESY